MKVTRKSEQNHLQEKQTRKHAF